MSQEKKTLTGSVALTRLKHVIMEKKGQSGIIRGIFIPIELNALEIVKYSSGGKEIEEITLPLRVIYNPIQDEKTKKNGFIAKSLPRDVYKEKKDDKAFLDEQQRILGNIKDWSNSGGYTPDNGSMTDDVVGEDDDLPF